MGGEGSGLVPRGLGPRVGDNPAPPSITAKEPTNGHKSKDWGAVCVLPLASAETPNRRC